MKRRLHLLITLMPVFILCSFSGLAQENVYAVTGGGSYCQGGTGVHVGLGGSQSGVSYQLYNGATPSGSPVTGTGSAIDFGLQTVAGTYTIVASPGNDNATNMSGSVVVSANPTPAVFAVSGGGTACANVSGNVSLSSSSAGVNYQLYNGTALVGAIAAGTGSGIALSAQTTGTYTVLATNAATGCTSTMSGNASVTALPIAPRHNVTGGGYYCGSATGVHVGLDASNVGVTYYLYTNASLAGSLSGAGSSLDFGLQATTGSYAILATYTSDGCTDTMTGGATVTYFSTINKYTVTGGGSYCQGGGGVEVSLSGTEPGVIYQLYNGSGPIGSQLLGSGLPMQFGLQTVAGNYSVIALPASASCSTYMNASANVTVIPLPTAYSVSGGGGYCPGSDGISVYLDYSDAGTKYQLYANNVPSGPQLTGSSASLNFGLQTTLGNYTVMALNNTTGCSGAMTGSVTVSLNPLPTSYTVTGGGGYCVGGSGSDVSLNGSQSGYSYQLMRGSSSVGAPVTGGGVGIDFGLQATSGAYTVVATNPSTSCVATMAGAATVTVNNLPNIYAVIGGGSYCQGGSGVSVALNGSDAGVNYQLYAGATPLGSIVGGTGSAISFGNETATGSYTVVGANAATNCRSTMSGSASVAAMALPAPVAVTGGGGYCPGGTGVHIGLASSVMGTTYQLNDSIGAVSAASGTGAAVDFGAFTGTGAYNVVATNPAGCSATMPGEAAVAIDPLPAVFSVTPGGPGSYCMGASGAPVGLSNSVAGINYQLFSGGLLVATVAGTGSSIAFGNQPAGSYSVVAVDGTTACSANMSDSDVISVNTPPTIYSVTGGGAYCAGGNGVDIALAASDAGINYMLMNGSATVATITGVGSPIDFGLQAASGTYAVVATNGTTLCSSTMSGNATVTMNQAPNATYTVDGGGAYCVGGSGSDISISNSDNGVNYQLMSAGIPVGAALPGFSGVAIDFGPQATPATYTVLATNAATSCAAALSGSVNVSINPLPIVEPVTGGGSYCYGSAGAGVTLSASVSGVNYQLMSDGLPVGIAITGTGAAIDFGMHPSGAYMVVATDPATSCSANMAGSAIVTAGAVMSEFAISGGGQYCAGGAGVDVGLEGSAPYVSYQLMYAGAPLGAPLAGSGTSLDFGVQTEGGNYTVVATNAATGCTATMAGTATVVVNSLPSTYNVIGGGDYCPRGAGVNVSLDGSDAGVSYQLMAGSIPVGSPMLSNGGPLAFGLQTIIGTYSAIAINETTSCTAEMNNTAVVGYYPLPAAYGMTGGGSYCAGAPGVHVGLSSSATGVSYQLYNGGDAEGAEVAGTGFALDFGAVASAGAYTVVGSNNTTTCVNTMGGTANVVQNALPITFDVTGGGSYCLSGSGQPVGLEGSATGVRYQLYLAGAQTGAPVTGTGSALSFGNQTETGNYTIVATDPSTTCTNIMAGSATINVNALPAVHIVSAGGSYCSDGAGVDVTLNGSAAGDQYQLYNGVTSVGASVGGTGGVLDFGNQTAGIYTVMAIDPATGCSNTMSGSSDVVANPLPAAFTVTGGGNYCSGGSGAHVGLSGSATGIRYQAFAGGAMSGSAVSGAGAAIDFGAMTTPGAYTITATNSTTGCSANMSGSVTVGVNPSPQVFAVTSSGNSYCAGGEGVDVALSNSTSGIGYQLYNGGAAVGVPVTGSGTGIDFGQQTGSGAYTVIATDPATSCRNTMTGGANIVINALPAAVTVVGGGSYCDGSTGVHIGLGSSHSGVNYQLYTGGASVSGIVAGTGAAIDFGLQMATGSYTVIATNPVSGCTNTMTGTPVVSVAPPPVSYTLTGGGNYCAGGAGAGIGLAGSASGVNYQLYNGAGIIGAPVVGTGSSVSFGPQTIAGTYTVTAINPATGCTSRMASAVTVGVNPQPTIYATSGGGNYCAGGTGVPVALAGSESNATYQLMNGSAAVGGPSTGSGVGINFGLQTAPGLYSVVATNTATGCSSVMSGAISVGVNPLPAVYTISGGGSYCVSGAGVHVGMSASATGVNYQLYNGAAVGAPVAGTGAALDFGLQAAVGTYTVIAINGTTACTSNMSGVATVTTTPMVSPSVTLSTVSDTVCQGNSVTLAATVVNGGITPVFAWKVNGAPVSAAGNSYTYVPANGDVVTVTMSSSAACATLASVSNSQGLMVMVNGVPAIDITATRGQVVCQGSEVTFSNVNAYGGNPSFTWMVNGIMTGSSPSFTYTPANGDQVYCVMTSDYFCRTGNTATSNNVTMEVDNNVSPSVAIAAYPGLSIAKGESLTLTASVTNGGETPAYQWLINNIPVQGANSASLTESNFNNGDSVVCQVTSSGGCAGLIGYSAVRIGVSTEGVQQITTAGSDIKVIPNPNNGIFVLKGNMGNASDEEVTLEVTDMLGQVVYTSKVMSQGGAINQQVQLGSGLANGMYILNLRSVSASYVYHVVIEQ